jgi:hypothetical protein
VFGNCAGADLESPHAWLVAFTYKHSAILLRCKIVERDDTVEVEVHIPAPGLDPDADHLVFESSQDVFTTLHRSIWQMHAHEVDGVLGVPVWDWTLQWFAVGQARVIDQDCLFSATRRGLKMTTGWQGRKRPRPDPDAGDAGDDDGGDGGGGSGADAAAGGAGGDGDAADDSDDDIIDQDELEMVADAIESELVHGGDNVALEGPAAADADLEDDPDVKGSAAEEAATVASALTAPGGTDAVIKHVEVVVASLDAKEDMGELDPVDAETRNLGCESIEILGNQSQGSLFLPEVITHPSLSTRARARMHKHTSPTTHTHSLTLSLSLSLLLLFLRSLSLSLCLFPSLSLSL